MNFAFVALSSALQRELHATCTVQRALYNVQLVVE